MTDNVKTLISSILMALGSYLLGKSIFGTVVDAGSLQTIVGSLLVIATFVASCVNHNSTLEMFQSLIRTVVVGIGGFLVASGRISSQMLETITGILIALSAQIYSWISRKKTLLISTGQIDVNDLKGAK